MNADHHREITTAFLQNSPRVHPRAPATPATLRLPEPQNPSRSAYRFGNADRLCICAIDRRKNASVVSYWKIIGQALLLPRLPRLLDQRSSRCPQQLQSQTRKQRPSASVWNNHPTPHPVRIKPHQIDDAQVIIAPMTDAITPAIANQRSPAPYAACST